MGVYEIALILKHIPNPCSSLLDVGCGRGLLAYTLRCYTNFKMGRIVGVEAHAPSLEFCRKHGIYDELWHYDIEAEGGVLPSSIGTFDCAVIIHVLEHLEKRVGLTLLKTLEGISRKIIVVAPVGVTGSKEEVAERDENPYQRHKSFWYVKDFRDNGFAVEGVGLKRYRFLRVFTPYIRRLRPEWSQEVVAVKEIE